MTDIQCDNMWLSCDSGHMATHTILISNDAQQVWRVTCQLSCTGSGDLSFEVLVAWEVVGGAGEDGYNLLSDKQRVDLRHRGVVLNRRGKGQHLCNWKDIALFINNYLCIHLGQYSTVCYHITMHSMLPYYRVQLVGRESQLIVHV